MDQSSLQRARRDPAKREAPVTKQDIFDEEYDDVWPTRLPGSARRYHSDVKMETGRMVADERSSVGGGYQDTRATRKNPVPARRTASQPIGATGRRVPVDTDEIVTRRSGNLLRRQWRGRRRVHWLVYAGLAVSIMLVGWFLFTVLGNWWQVTQDDWRYGRPRTYQTDQVVGHNDSALHPSHFVALNLNRHVQVIEFPGDDSTKVKIYLGPVLVGAGQDLAPVTLTFKDVNGDGKVDMIVNVQDSHFIFINDNGEFRTPHAGEQFQS